MWSPPLKLMAALALVTSFFLFKKFGSVWWWQAILLCLMSLLLIYNGCRMLIYERFLNPLSRLPGPKVLHADVTLLIYRATGSGESFMHSYPQSPGNLTYDGYGSIEIQPASYHIQACFTLAESCQRRVSHCNMF